MPAVQKSEMNVFNVTENKRSQIVDGVNKNYKERIEELRRRVVVRKKYK